MEDKLIMGQPLINGENELDELKALLDHVPTGLGIYEITQGKAVQKYMNKAFYDMLGTTREERRQFFGANAMNAAHPDDVPKILKIMEQLTAGEDCATVVYRLKHTAGQWYWLKLTASVVERRENYLKIYGSFADYNSVMIAQEEMEKNSASLKVALEAAKVLTWRYDYKTRTVTDSLTLGEHFHLPKVIEKIPQAIIDYGFIAEESQADFRALFDRLENEDIVSIETKANIRDTDGYLWYKQIYTKNFDVHGNYIDFLGVALDITEQKRREQQYEEKLHLNKLALQNAISHISLNLTQNKITGFFSSDANFQYLGQLETAEEFLTNIKFFVPPKELGKFAHVANVKAMLDFYAAGNNHLEVFCHHWDNNGWLKITYDLLENPYTNDIEEVSAVYDVTEEIRAQKMVEQLLNVDYQSIVLIDSETGTMTPYRNKEGSDILYEALKLQKEVGNGQAGLEAFIRRFAVEGTAERVIEENCMSTVMRVLQDEPYYETTYSLVYQGNTEHYRVLYSYLENDQRILFSAIQRITNIYERELTQKLELAQALERAESANKAKTAFLSRVSHDMRTPLNGILGLTTLLQDSVQSTKIKDDLRRLELSGKYLLNLINDTLDVSRIESGALELHPVVCKGEELFSNIMELAQINAQNKSVELKVTAGKIPFTILYVDAARLEQIVLNVIGNAIKFTPKGGRVEVTMEHLSVEAGIITDKLVVKDNGVGMSKEFLPRIFEAFAQEDVTRTSNYQGTGLGMSITKEILEKMGGSISVESELGKGSTFTLFLKLPIANKEQVASWHQQHSHTEKSLLLAGKRVLLCEDHPLNTLIATRLLAAKGMLVEHAANGKEGVDMFTKSSEGYYDVILMDIRMPVLDGLAATQEIRALKRKDAAQVPIIAMTANAFNDDKEQSKLVGMNAHLSKPIETDMLYATLGELLPKQEA